LTVTQAYLDWNATGRLRPQAHAAVAAALAVTGNPSSVHAAGRAARHLVEAAREQVAALAGAAARDVVFTSGGTEANMLALTPALGDALLVSAVEHPSVLSGGRFAAVEEIPVSPDGVVDLAALQRRLGAVSRPLVSIMLANNESGVIQPVAKAAEIVHAAGGLLHVDAVQGPGRIACDFGTLGADLMTLSGHKLGGPQGVGALYISPGTELEPVVFGGGQENGVRSGTHNVAGAVGMAVAAELATAELEEESARLRRLRDRLEAALLERVEGLEIHASGCERLPQILNVCVHGIQADAALLALDAEGLCVSTGSACKSGSFKPSHVLSAMGRFDASAADVDGQAELPAVIRFSLGHSTTDADVDAVIERFPSAVGRLRELALT
jgi:cysteine desulfurase